MPQPAILGPFREGNLCHTLRFDPADTSLRHIIFGKRGDICFDSSKLLRKAFQNALSTPVPTFRA